MPVMRTYECEICGHAFDFLHMSRAEPAPDECPACKNVVPFVTLPSQAKPGGSPLGRASDSAYNELEAGSLFRAAQAKDAMVAAGVPDKQAESAANDLKITNMRDNMRVGDVAAMPTRPSNIVSQYADAAQHQFFQAPIAQVIAGTKEGKFRGTGAGALAAIQGAKLGRRA